MANKAMELPDQKQFKVKKKRRWVKPLIGMSIVIGIGTIIYMNRDQIAVYTKDIPILNKIFPLPEQVEDPYAGLQLEEVIEELKQANNQVIELQSTLDAKTDEIVSLNAKNEVLEEYEKNYTAFQQQKEEWDESVARSNPDLYIEQFETINPELAGELYQELRAEEEWHKEYNKYANTIGSMDEEKAAEALEQLLATDPVLVKQIFEHMDIERQSLILSQMSTNGATQVIKLISPESEGE